MPELTFVEQLLQLVVEGAPNLLALIVMVAILWTQGKRHEERLDELLDVCFDEWFKRRVERDRDTRQEETD